MIKGSLVALVTPMHADGTIDRKSLFELIEWHIAAKTAGIVVTGSTGEAATLTEEEQYTLIADVVKQVANRLPVIAGTGSCATEHTIRLTCHAQKAGANAALVITPYYNKPTQKGLFEHYKKISQHSSLPIILYNVPARTACDILPETIERLAAIPTIIGIKEATGKMERITDIKKRCGKSFAIYSGDDETGLESILNGAAGVISVTANLAPHKMQTMCQAALTGDLALAKRLNAELSLLHRDLFLESNPIPAKWALHQMGLIPPGIRLPLLTLSSSFHSALQEAMSQAGITQTN